MFCGQPFEKIEIYENGEVYTCCPPFLQFYSIGNIFNEPFDEIWNGKKAQEFRQKMLNGDLSTCLDICNRKFLNEKPTNNHKLILDKYPEEISVSTDNICNINCTICRDNGHNIQQKDFEQELEGAWLPVFKNAKIVRFGCSGEPFSSLKEKALIKKITEKYPNVRFQFHTNGILGSELILKELNVYDRIEIMTVSMHSATEEIYNKVCIGGNYQRVIQNLNLYSKMKKENLIQFFRMIFVVYSENYKDMTKFIELAEELGAEAQFWAYRKNDTEIGRNYEKYSIIEPSHPLNKDLVNMLKQDIFNKPNVILYPELQALKNQ